MASQALHCDTAPTRERVSNNYLRRKEAAARLREKFGFGSTATLNKLACIGGGPPFRKVGSRVALYDPTDLDDWAISKLGRPQTSTSDVLATGFNPKECA
jgi:hypothetical protein